MTEKSCFTHFMCKVPWVKTLSNHLPLATSTFSWSSLVAQMVKNLPAVQKASVGRLGWEDSLEEGMATHSSILAWRIPMDRGAWRATVHGVTKSQTRLSDFHWLTDSTTSARLKTLHISGQASRGFFSFYGAHFSFNPNASSFLIFLKITRKSSRHSKTKAPAL